MSEGMLSHAIWIATHSILVFVSVGSLVLMDLSTTSHKCSIGLMSGERAGHTIRQNTPECSSNQFWTHNKH